jgi:hypothetical protein
MTRCRIYPWKEGYKLKWKTRSFVKGMFKKGNSKVFDVSFML